MASSGPVDVTLANGDPNGTPISMTTFPAALTIAARTADHAHAERDGRLHAAVRLHALQDHADRRERHPQLRHHRGKPDRHAAARAARPHGLLLRCELPQQRSVVYIPAGGHLAALPHRARSDGATGGYMATVTSSDIALTIQAGGEGNDTTNNAYTGATVLSAPPVEVQGASLSSATDIDYYAVTVPAGKAIHVQTVPGDDSTEATVLFYNSDGTTILPDPDQTDPTMPVDNFGPEDTVSNAVTTAGTYYIAIGFSQDPEATPWSADESHYNLHRQPRVSGPRTGEKSSVRLSWGAVSTRETRAFVERHTARSASGRHASSPNARSLPRAAGCLHRADTATPAHAPRSPRSTSLRWDARACRRLPCWRAAASRVRAGAWRVRQRGVRCVRAVFSPSFAFTIAEKQRGGLAARRERNYTPAARCLTR